MSVRRLTQRSVQQMQTTRKRTDTLHDRRSLVRPEVLRSGHTCLEALWPFGSASHPRTLIRRVKSRPSRHRTRRMASDGFVRVHSLPFGFELTCVGGFAATASGLCDECPADIDHTAPCTRQSETLLCLCIAFNVSIPEARVGKFDRVYATVFVYLTKSGNQAENHNRGLVSIRCFEPVVSLR